MQAEVYKIILSAYVKNNFFVPIATINAITTINRLHPPYDAIRINVAGKTEASRWKDKNEHEI